jgi:hypothetical protein
VFNLLEESSSQFGESENKNAGDGYPMKAIEKLVLRFLGSHTFSHGLDPKPTSAQGISCDPPSRSKVITVPAIVITPSCGRV